MVLLQQLKMKQLALQMISSQAKMWSMDKSHNMKWTPLREHQAVLHGMLLYSVASSMASSLSL